MNWYLAVLKKYAVFTGRARRKEYWMFFLFNFIVSIMLSIIEVMFGIAPDTDQSVLTNIYVLAVALPSIGVSIRRMHDTGHSGWWSIVPVVGVVFTILEGEHGDNRFGSDPKASSPTADDEILTNNEVLTNEAVLAMIHARLGDGVIVNKIQYSRCEFRLSSAELDNLKQQGASDVVMAAMLESQTNRCQSV
jgi:uncharacterized membrane protein YhaH (DUF805 family)